MNKRTVALTTEQYKEIISTIKRGFLGHRPNERIATALMLEANLGLRISDVLKLRLNDIVQDPPISFSCKRRKNARRGRIDGYEASRRISFFSLRAILQRASDLKFCRPPSSSLSAARGILPLCRRSGSVTREQRKSNKENAASRSL